MFTFIHNILSTLTVHAQETEQQIGGYTLLQPLPGFSDAGIETYLQDIIWFAIGISTVLAVIWITIGGFEIMTTDAYYKRSEGKKKIWNAIIGLVLIAASFILLTTINPDLLDINLTRLDQVEAPEDQPAPTPTPSPSAGGIVGGPFEEEIEKNANVPKDYFSNRFCFTYRVTSRSTSFGIGSVLIKCGASTTEENLSASRQTCVDERLIAEVDPNKDVLDNCVLNHSGTPGNTGSFSGTGPTSEDIASGSNIPEGVLFEDQYCFQYRVVTPGTWQKFYSDRQVSVIIDCGEPSANSGFAYESCRTEQIKRHNQDNTTVINSCKGASQFER